MTFAPVSGKFLLAVQHFATTKVPAEYSDSFFTTSISLLKVKHVRDNRAAKTFTWKRKSRSPGECPSRSSTPQISLFNFHYPS